MPITNSLAAVANYLETLLETNKVALGLLDVYYGDQNRIPRTPSACIDPGEKRRTLNGMPRRTSLDITVYILIYHNPVKGVEVVARETDAITELVETQVHTNASMGGLVIDSMVTNVEFGYQTRGATLYRVSRLTVEARSQVQLPSSV